MAKTAGAAAAILAPAVAVPAARKVSKLAHGASDLVGEGKELAGKASDAMDTASNVKDAVSSHSSTIGKVGGAIKAVAQHGKSGGGNKPKLSHLIEQHTDIAAPRSVVYNQWTQMEMFPTLVKGIESAEQEEDDKVKWTSKIGPSRRTWTGRIVEQVPDERIAWKSEGGASIQGAVTFHSLDVDLTRVLLQMEYKPTGAVEWVGNTLRIQRRRAKRDLRLFKHFVEVRGEETGAWRGRIDADEKLEPKFSGQGSVERSKAQGARKRSSGNGGGTSSGRTGEDRNRGRSSAGRGSSGSNGSGRSSSTGVGSNGHPDGRRRTSSSTSRRSGTGASNGRNGGTQAARSRRPARSNA